MSDLLAVKHAVGPHVSEEMLGLYLLGDLSVTATVAAEEHLAWCSRCKGKLPRVEALIAALRPCTASAHAVR